MIKQKKLIYSLEWDYIIILDACRVDSFTDLYPRFLDGELWIVETEGPCTIEWARRTFTKPLNVVYYSANPYVNSKVKLKGWLARDYFKRVVDLWLTCWDTSLNTVPPWLVNERIRVDKPKSKTIIHYVQPHGPWIGETKLQLPALARKPEFQRSPGDIIAEMIERGELTEEKLRRAHWDNLKLVLKYVTELTTVLEGRIIVTSDHSECLGEKYNSRRIYIHPCIMDFKFLRTVPWLIVH